MYYYKLGSCHLLCEGGWRKGGHNLKLGGGSRRGGGHNLILKIKILIMLFENLCPFSHLISPKYNHLGEK